MRQVFAWLFACSLLLIGNPVYAWEYEKTVDTMSSKEILFANTRSTNSLNLDFPYKGKNHGNLQIRQHPKYGLSVIFSVDKGQIQCRSYSGCPIEIRFDDQASMMFSGSPSADNSSDTVFINTPSKFIALAKKANRILVRVNIYQAGAPTLEFVNAKPLTWAAAATTPKKDR